MTESSAPIPPNLFAILFALGEGEKHGYAMMRELRIGPAMLYTAIRKMIDSEWIEETEGPENADQRRKYYRLTKSGASTLRAELGRMESLVRRSKSMRTLFREGSS